MPSRQSLLFSVITTVIVVAGIISPALAHHPFGMGEGSELSILQGLASGIGHPLLGPDHLLFMLAIGLVGLRNPSKWVLPLLLIGFSLRYLFLLLLQE